ncbi:hypothetical protein RRG08_020274 [Elysia crispata]|uniref:Uncharacterized protein n=1 Tax=Elysia crispata TaxID=231223 RepID=A0AAE0YY19_9GAST|nr:hypothetical protein RRG08_020274 [Elysia crispata]
MPRPKHLALRGILPRPSLGWPRSSFFSPTPSPNTAGTPSPQPASQLAHTPAEKPWKPSLFDNHSFTQEFSSFSSILLFVIVRSLSDSV